jgi:hypothetical protein
MKKLNYRMTFQMLLCCFIGLYGLALNAQNSHSCGDYKKPESKKSGEYKALSVDRFGNTYSIADKTHFGNSSEKALICGSNAIFEINLLGTFSPAEEMRICDVFSYLQNTVGILTPPAGKKVKIDIKKTNDGLPPNAWGAASAYYNLFACGVQNSLVWEKLVAGVEYNPPITPGGIDGFILLSPTATWYTGTGTPPATEVDLFSVVLHESMHLLGFASLITEGGNSGFQGFYSNYDQFLYSNPGNNPLLVQMSQDGCCDHAEYNSNIQVPELLMDGSCNLVFKTGSTNVPINTVSVGSVTNSLSHLNSTSCGNPDYVMGTTLLAGQERRVLSSDELAILSSLGMRSPNSNCVLVAMNDYGLVATNGGNLGSPYVIPISSIWSNDIRPSSGNEISIIIGCGDQSTVMASVVQQNISMNGSIPPGTYTLCYSLNNNTASGCINECDQASFTFTIPQAVDPLPVISSHTCDESHFDYGNFNEFYPFFGSTANQPYFARLGLPTIDCPMNVTTENTPDIFWISGGDRCLGIRHSPNSQREAIYMPITPGIPPGL